MTIDGKKTPAGNYARLTIPDETEWTIVFISGVDQWGTYSYNPTLAVARLNVPVQKSDAVTENFFIQFAKKDAENATTYLGRDTTMVAMPMGL